MIFVLPTRYEGFGISLLEAAVSGLKVITTNIPVLRESLKDQNVIFFEMDNVNDLSEKIQASLQESNSINKIQSKQLYGWKSTKTKFLLISGKPIGEKIARGGPFVMNTKEEILQAIQDYQNGTFVS